MRLQSDFNALLQVAMIDDKTLVLLGVGDIMFIIRSPPFSPNQNHKPAFISIISGTGEYDETVLLHALKSLLVVLKSLYFEKTPNEALVIEARLRPQQLNPKPLTVQQHYAKTCLAVEEMICGGVLELVDASESAKNFRMMLGEE
jgi:hypothetical protein